MDINTKYYDNKVEENLHKFLVGNPRIHSAWRTILDSMDQSPPPNRIVDFGCGIGETAWRCSIMWPQCVVSGIDPSVGAIKVAEKIFTRHQLDFIVGEDSGLVGLKDVDMFLMIDVLEHIPAYERASLFAKISSTLSNQGKLILTFPSPEYQSYLRKNKPEEVQPIDEDIEVDLIQELASITSTKIVKYSYKSIFKKNDYVHVVLSKEPVFVPVLKKQGMLSRTLLERVIGKLGFQRKLAENPFRLPDTESCRKSLARKLSLNQSN